MSGIQWPVSDIVLNRLMGSRECSDETKHLVSTMEWLRAAYRNGSGGVASHYFIVSRQWGSPFPETTGYIIETFLEYAGLSGEALFYDEAMEMANWLSSVQLETGACIQGVFREGDGSREPCVFNTGQNIFGFLDAFDATENESFLECALRAGDFLVSSCDGADQVWRKAVYHGIPHTYNSRTAWALLRLYSVSGEEAHKSVAISNLDWVINQQLENGWFENASFKPDELPNTHGVAYTLRGLLESGLLTGRSDFIEAAERTARVFVSLVERGRFLKAFWNREWRNRGKFFNFLPCWYLCITGNAQLALVFMKLAEVTGNDAYRCSAKTLIHQIMRIQGNQPKILSGVRGGVSGSFPVFGGYSFMKQPNWAAKFFADALMMSRKTSLRFPA